MIFANALMNERQLLDFLVEHKNAIIAIPQDDRKHGLFFNMNYPPLDATNREAWFAFRSEFARAVFLSHLASKRCQHD